MSVSKIYLIGRTVETEGQRGASKRGNGRKVNRIRKKREKNEGTKRHKLQNLRGRGSDKEWETKTWVGKNGRKARAYMRNWKAKKKKRG